KLGWLPLHATSSQSDRQLVWKLWSEKYPLTACRIAGSLLTIRIKPVLPMSRSIDPVPLRLPARLKMRREFGIGAFVGCEQQPFQIGNKVALLEFSRSSLSFSSLVNGSRASADRSIGGIAMVVRIAMVMIIENRVWLSTPMERPIVATIT